MTNDDSEQIAAARRRGRPHAATRERRREPVDARSRRSDRSPTASPQIAGSALRPTAKFSGLQSLENSQNGERISIFREPVRHPRGAALTDQPVRRTVGLPLTIEAFSPGRASGNVDGGLDRDR
jgi:hypothetical protein